MRTNFHVNPGKGFLVGAVAGLVASAAMGTFHSMAGRADPSPQPAKEDSTEKAAEAVSETVLHHHLTPGEKKVAGPAVHFGFGAFVAGLYGAAVEFAPALRTGWGLPFGAAVYLGAHALCVPALGLSEPVTKSSPRKEAVEFGAHLLYGAVVEGVRSVVVGKYRT